MRISPTTLHELCQVDVEACKVYDKWWKLNDPLAEIFYVEALDCFGVYVPNKLPSPFPKQRMELAFEE